MRSAAQRAAFSSWCSCGRGRGVRQEDAAGRPAGAPAADARRRRHRGASARAARAGLRADDRAARAGARRRASRRRRSTISTATRRSSRCSSSTTAASSPATAQAVLDDNAAVLKQYSSWTVTIEGHCDERGTAEYNLALGERRARGRARLSGVARHLRRIGCGRSATARSSRSIRDTTKRRGRRTAARISSSRRSETVMTADSFSARSSRSSLASRASRAPAARGRQGTAADDGRHPHAAGAGAAAAEPDWRAEPTMRRSRRSTPASMSRPSSNRKSFADQKLVIDTLTERSARSSARRWTTTTCASAR